MGATNVPESPIIFSKPLTSITPEGVPLVLPQTVVHHEIELAVLIGRGGKDIPESQALEHVGGYAIALDFTARDI